MVFYCTSCKRKYTKQCGFKFFSFPRKEVLRNEWLKACRLDLHPDNDFTNLRVCSAHFEKTNFRLTREGGPLLLKPDAIPSIFPTNKPSFSKENLNEETNSSKTTVTTTELDPIINVNTTVELDLQKKVNANSEISTREDYTFSTPKRKRQIWGPRHALQMSPSHFSTPRRAHRNLVLIKEDVKKKDMRIKQLLQKIYRMRKKIKSLEQLIEHLQDL